jgi:hypothetical protein
MPSFRSSAWRQFFFVGFDFCLEMGMASKMAVIEPTTQHTGLIGAFQSNSGPLGCRGLAGDSNRPKCFAEFGAGGSGS